MCKFKALHVYKINIHQVLLFMFKTKHGLSPKVFDSRFTEFRHKYYTRFSENNFVAPKFLLKLGTYTIRYRGPLFWNIILSSCLKLISTFTNSK